MVDVAAFHGMRGRVVAPARLGFALLLGIVLLLPQIAAAKSILIYGPSMSPAEPGVDNEETLATAAGYTVTVADATTWLGLSTAQFAGYDAIVFGDPTCAESPAGILDAALANRATWSAAVTGHVVAVNGTDPILHQNQAGTQAKALIMNGVNFAASGPGTGLYVSLSCYYSGAAPGTTVGLLASFGTFQVEGQSSGTWGAENGCPNTIAITEPTHPVMAGLSVAGLSNWGCSIHEAFTAFPNTFVVLARHDPSGKPYILATPGIPAPTITGITSTPNPSVVGRNVTFTATVTNATGWVGKTSMPTSRSSFGAGTIDGIVYAAGGTIFPSCSALATLEAYNPATDTWRTKASMRTPRYSPAVAVANNQLYVIGGGNNCSGALNTVEAYDPATDTWTTKAPLPTTRRNARAEVINGIIYVVGGLDDSTLYTTVHAYDPATDTWTTKRGIMPTRILFATGVVKDILYVVGGGDASGFITAVDAYDPVADTWTRRTSPIPTSRSFVAGAVANDVIYAIGGSSATRFAAVETYDPATDTWTVQPSLRTARSELAAAVANGVVYAIGGLNDADQPLTVVESFTQVTGTVTFREGKPILADNVPLNGSAQATFSTSKFPIGTHTVTAFFNGTLQFAASRGSVDHVVQGRPQVITVTQHAPASAAFATSFVVAATGGGSGNPVVIAGVGACTGAGSDVATITMTSGTGICTVTFNQAGNDTFAAAPQVTEVTTAEQAATTTTLTSSVTPSVFGQPTTFTATVNAASPDLGTPTGIVTFRDGETTLGTSALSGNQATFTTSALAVGSHSVTAAYGGDANFHGSTGSAGQTVNKAATTTTLTSSASQTAAANSVTFSATVAPVSPGAGTPTGTVTFRDGETLLGSATLTSGVAVFSTDSLADGSHLVAAQYGGDGNFNGSASNTVTLVVVNVAPFFDPIANQTVNENTGPQSVAITGVSAGPTVEQEQTVTFSTVSSNPAVVPAPVVGAGSSPQTRTLTFQPTPNANGTATITVTANDGQTQNNLFSRTFTITVNAVNDRPYFNPIDPPLFDLTASQTVVETQVAITGVSAGPADEAAQVVTVTATSNNTAVIANPTITGTGSTRTLTFRHGATLGTAEITVVATDNGGTMNGGVDTFKRTFSVTVSRALSGEVSGTIASLTAPADPGGFVPNETIDAVVAITFPTRDFTGDGQPDCYFVVPPGSNLVPRIDDTDADNIPEFGPTVYSEAALRRVCDQPVTLTGTVRLTDWYTNVLRTPGTHNVTVTYVQLTQDPEQADCDNHVAGASCFSPVLKEIVPVSGTITVGSPCGGVFGTLAGGTGCPFAVKSTVTLHSVPLGGSPTKTPMGGVQVRVFDRNSAELQALVAAGGGTNPHPEASLHALIFEHNVGRVGSCTTTTGGVCFAGLTQTGDYLVITKFADANTGQRVYAGREVSAKDFVNGVAAREFQIVKVVNKLGKVQYSSGASAVLKGSFLEMILPDSAMWEGARFIYPFIFTSDSTWQVNVCAEVPSGYSVVGAYDESGELRPSTTCVLSIIANQTKVVAFEVIDVGSPEPSLDATLTIRTPHGKTEIRKVKTADIRRESFETQMRETKGDKSGTRHGAHSH